jgi:uncharacterized protein (DUF1501 family)
MTDERERHGYEPDDEPSWYDEHDEYDHDEPDDDEPDHDEPDDDGPGDDRERAGIGERVEALAALVTRRRFLAGLAVSGAGGYGAMRILGRDDGLASSVPSTTSPTSVPTGGATTAPAAPTVAADLRPVSALPGVLVPAPVEQRILLLIELEGGNDGPSTVVPAGTGAYYDLRPNLAVADDQVLNVDNEIGLSPHLARLYHRQFAVVEGVGPVDGSLSHFEMVARWEKGDPSGGAGQRAGFLARLADSVDDGGISVGLSVSGFTPRFSNVTANTLALDELDQLWVLTEDEWIYPSYRRAVSGITGGPMTDTMAASWNHLFTIGNALPSNLDDIDKGSPMIADGGDIGRALATAAAMLKADIGVRVVHARMSGFDTHDGHAWRHEDLMTRLDVALDGFLGKMAEYGLAERVLVATSSEFGRRVRQNGSGFDHGNASTMLLFGPVLPGRYGQAPSLTDLDDHGNLKTTVPFDSYLGTLAETWLGVEAGSVLPTAPEVLPILAS